MSTFRSQPSKRWPRAAVALAGTAAVSEMLLFGSVPSSASASAGPVTPGVVQSRAVVPGGPGYWLVSANGKVYPFGGAKFYGDASGYALNKPIVGIVATPDGAGYWLVAADGGVFSFGDASFYGSEGAAGTPSPVVAGAVVPSLTAGPTGPTGPAGPAGPAGPTGPTGPTGPSPVVISGYINGQTCTQLTASTSYSVSVTGSGGNAYCLITISPAFVMADPIVSASSSGSIASPQLVQVVLIGVNSNPNQNVVGLAEYSESGGSLVNQTDTSGANDIMFQLSAPSS